MSERVDTELAHFGVKCNHQSKRSDLDGYECSDCGNSNSMPVPHQIPKVSKKVRTFLLYCMF